MRISTTRHALAPSKRPGLRRPALRAAVAAAAALTALLPAPAGAAESATTCQTLLQSTPGATVDLDGDGYPEARVPSVHDVVLCSDSNASYATYTPEIERCFVGWHPTCAAVYVTVVPVSAQAGARADLYYKIDGQQYSATLSTAPLPTPVRQTVCIGADLYGGHPCSGSVFTFE